MIPSISAMAIYCAACVLGIMLGTAAALLMTTVFAPGLWLLAVPALFGVGTMGGLRLLLGPWD